MKLSLNRQPETELWLEREVLIAAADELEAASLLASAEDPIGSESLGSESRRLLHAASEIRWAIGSLYTETS